VPDPELEPMLGQSLVEFEPVEPDEPVEVLDGVEPVPDVVELLPEELVPDEVVGDALVAALAASAPPVTRPAVSAPMASPLRKRSFMVVCPSGLMGIGVP
jgi:hypothetical protein